MNCSRNIPLRDLRQETLYEQISGIQRQYKKPHTKYAAFLTEDDIERLRDHEEHDRYVTLQQGAILTMDDPIAVMVVTAIYTRKNGHEFLDSHADATQQFVVVIRWGTDENGVPCSGQAYEQVVK